MKKSEVSEKVKTLEGSTFWKFLTTEITRPVTSDLSRKEPLTSSENRRHIALKVRAKNPLLIGLALRDRGRDVVFTLRCFSKVPLTAAISISSPLLFGENGFSFRISYL